MFNSDLPGRGRGRLHNQGSLEPTLPDLTLQLEKDLVLDPPGRSNLSAEAKEWFPPNYVAPTPHNFYPRQGNVGHHFPRPGGHPPRGEYFRRSYEQNHYQSPRFSTQDTRNNQFSQGFVPQNSISHLVRVMCEVSLSPGKFSLLSGPLVDSFSSTLNDLHQTEPLVNAIVNQAIAEQNFRYNGARLCTMFDSVEPRVEAPSLFRICLLERCAIEEAKVVNGTEPSNDNICGFAMFLAELYMQLENLEGGRIKALGESLCIILKYLIETSNANCVKSVCQILKLSGLALDADCKIHMDEIFSGLHKAEQAGIQTLLVRNVINLRHSRWGSGGFAEMVDIEVTQTPPASDSMFYLPEGHSLTQEESAFLNQHLPSSDDQFYSNGTQDFADSFNWDPEMNEEQRDDYIKFLMMSNQIAQ